MRVYVCEDTNEVCYDYKAYLKTEHWRLKKEEYFSVYKKECAICKDKRKLHLHHKTYDNVGKERLEDLVLLCEQCHNKVHNDECDDEESVKNTEKAKKKRDVNNPITHFNFKEDETIMLPCKIGRECRNSKRKGVINISGNELFIYCIMIKSKNFVNINIDNIMEFIANKKTGKHALSKPTILKALKGLKDKGYIDIIKGNARLGIKDTYRLTNIETNRVKLFKINSVLIDKIINKEITPNELKVYIRMRYLHNEDVLKCKSKGNTYAITLYDLSSSLKMDHSNVSQIIKRLDESSVLDRTKIPMGVNIYTYEFKFNY